MATIVERFEEIYGAQNPIEETPNPLLKNEQATIEEDAPNSDLDPDWLSASSSSSLTDNSACGQGNIVSVTNRFVLLNMQG